MIRKRKRETPASMTPQDVYSKLWRIADSILRENNPCQIQLDTSGVASCSRTRKEPNYEGPDRKGVLCCGGCRHLGPTGCTVESLGCKLGGCSGIAALPMYAPNASAVNFSLSLLATAAEESGFHLWPSVRRSKEEYFVYEARVQPA